MVEKVNGRVMAGEFLSGNMQFFTVTTAVDIRMSDDGGSADSQKALDKLVEVISMNGQPVLLGAPYSDGGTPANYIFKFAIDKADAWKDAAALVAALATHGVGKGFTGVNTSAVIAERL